MGNYFDNTAYNPTEVSGSMLKDASDAYGNMGFVVSFYHMISSKSLRFKGYITVFNETYSPDFAAEQVFGRADPIYTIKTQIEIFLWPLKYLLHQPARLMKI